MSGTTGRAITAADVAEVCYGVAALMARDGYNLPLFMGAVRGVLAARRGASLTPYEAGTVDRLTVEWDEASA